MRTLLHAVAVMLTVLLLLRRPRYTFAAVCYKRIATPFIPNNMAKSNSTSLDISCNGDAYFVDPKLKRDPEIELDDEDIGPQPLI